MKFNTVFVLFTVIITLFLVFACLFPVFLLDTVSGALFWRAAWPLPALLAAALAVLVAVYLSNRRLMSLVERADWPALAQYLELKVIRQGHFSPHLVRLLAQCYLTLSEPAACLDLEVKAAARNPALTQKNVLLFGVAHILAGDFSGAVKFFERYVAQVRSGAADWPGWFYAYARFLNKQYGLAASQFTALGQSSRNMLVTGLSGLFLAGQIAGALPSRVAECVAAADGCRIRVRKTLPAETDWKREAGNIRSDFFSIVIAPFIEGAGVWLYMELTE